MMSAGPAGNYSSSTRPFRGLLRTSLKYERRAALAAGNTPERAAYLAARTVYAELCVAIIDTWLDWDQIEELRPTVMLMARYLAVCTAVYHGPSYAETLAELRRVRQS
jgi:hypothetical protein